LKNFAAWQQHFELDLCMNQLSSYIVEELGNKDLRDGQKLQFDAAALYYLRSTSSSFVDTQNFSAEKEK